MSKGQVTQVNSEGAVVVWDGERTLLTWGELERAATQPNVALAAVYTELRDQAADMARKQSPLIVRSGRDSSNVMFHAWVETVWGGFGATESWRAADEGGQLPTRKLARSEALDIAARIKHSGRDAFVEEV